MALNQFQIKRLARRQSPLKRWVQTLCTPLIRCAKWLVRFCVALLQNRGRWSFKTLCIRGILCGIGIMILYGLFVWFTLPDLSNPRSLLASQSTIITDRNGVELYRLFAEEDRTYIEGSTIPLHAKHAIVAIEDKRYYERGCLDIRAIARAVFRLGTAGGGSTLTRQLARNALDLKKDNRYHRKVKELVLGCQLESTHSKEELLELYLNWIPFGRNAYGIEQASQAYFGISAADLTLAQSTVLAALPQRPTYFSPYGSHQRTKVDSEIEEAVLDGVITSASNIGDEQITIGLLGATIGTGTTTVYVGGRTDQVLFNMEEQGWITEAEKLQALEELESMTFNPLRENIRAPHFVLWIREQVEGMLSGSEEGMLEQGGLLVETSLDWELQQIAEDVIAFHRADILERHGAQNIALIALHPETREVLAYAGNADFSDTEHGGKIDMIQVPRQPGSSFKPFVYAAAFEKGYNPATVLFDVETEIGDNTPQNFDGKFNGPMTIRQALGASRNIPAAKAFFLAGGEERILQFVASLGATSPLSRRDELNEVRADGFDYGWPLALGAAETPLYEMANAYASFAEGGVAKKPISIRKISDKHGNILLAADMEDPGERVLDERIAYQITSVLSDESVRPEEYWKTQLTVPGYQTAAKTGTSNKCLEWEEDDEGREFCMLRKPDNAWLLGYTPLLVAGAWAGNADSTSMLEKAGGLNTASPIWRDFMVQAHKEIVASKPVVEEEKRFTPPEGIVQPQISLLSGELPTDCTPVELRRADVFLEENPPTLQDPACANLTVDLVTGLIASDECPDDAEEDGSFFVAKSILPNRWPKWEEGVQVWMEEQMELWNATDNHSGSLLTLPRAPTEYCDPSLTPGRLDAPEVRFVKPLDGNLVAHPVFSARIDYEVGSSVQEVKYFLNNKRVAKENRPPFRANIRVPRSIKASGTHTLRVELVDEYFNKAEEEIRIRFGEDTTPPSVRITEPREGTTVGVGSDITIRASADDGDGAIKYVQFYLDDTLLTTKPNPPFELTYTMDVERGAHTFRAVAEDMAKKRSEDSLQIFVGDPGVFELPDDTPKGTGVAQPSLIKPGVPVTIGVNEVIDIEVEFPTIGTKDILTAHVVIEDAVTGGESDTILDLSDGGGTYKRQWKARRAGQYAIIILTEDQNRQKKEWVRSTVEVK